jgi:putative transposase
VGWHALTEARRKGVVDVARRGCVAKRDWPNENEIRSVGILWPPIMRVHDSASGDSWFRKRRKRYDGNRDPRELTFSCYCRFPFLERDRVRLWFIEALRNARERWPVDVWAYVLMPEHVHLLVNPRKPKIDVARFAGFVKEHTARPAIRWLQENAPEFLPKITVIEGSVTRRRF